MTESFHLVRLYNLSVLNFLFYLQMHFSSNCLNVWSGRKLKRNSAEDVTSKFFALSITRHRQSRLSLLLFFVFTYDCHLFQELLELHH